MAKKKSADPMDEARRRIAAARENGRTELDLSGLGLTSLPPEIAALTALQTLDLDGNQLTALPPEIAALTALQELSLIDNQLTALPPEIAALTALQGLNLNRNQLTALPPEIAALTTLQGLGLGRNHLTALPPEIAALTALQSLDLDGNQLTALPPEIAALTALQRLVLNHNKLTALPSEIPSLTTLQELYLGANQLRSLPPELAALTALRGLFLFGNRLTTLPPELAALAALRHVTLNRNQLTSLPPEIAALTALQQVDLRKNQLTALPPEIAALTALRTLGLDGNPLPQSYFDALKDGIPNLFALLRSLAGETAPLFEAKLIVTGEGQVGKSWALAALRGDDPRKAVGEANTTWGIDLGRLDLPHPEKPGVEIHLNSWDFGGQAVYRVTHQFFFSEQALYLLVWNPRKGPVQCRVREWLRAIALRTGIEVAPDGIRRPRARVIMVATHAEAAGGNYSPEYGHDSLEADLRAMIVGSIAIDSETGHKVSALHDLIARHAAALPDMGSPFNTKWAAAREAALALRDERPWITFGEFKEICAQQDVTGQDDIRTLAGTFMHRLGRAVWYGPGAAATADSADALLADTLVLDAVWLSRAFVQVLEDPPTRDSGGMLDRHRFPAIWTEHGRPEWRVYRPEEYDRLARMMRRFDVALPTRASAGERSLVPQLVPAIRPDLPWAAAEAADGQHLVRLACRLDYEADGLMPRFIAATEPYHLYQQGKGLFWQEGVFLRDVSSFANDALVTVEGVEKPLVTIIVAGDQPGFLMSELQRTLEAVIAFWKGMTATWYFLCPTVDADGAFCPGRFKRDTVQRRAAKSSGRELDCQDCDAEWSPEDLLYGLKGLRARRGADYKLDFLFHQQKVPCPRAFILRPADPAWHKVTSWSSFAGKRFKITLVSELSGKTVASDEFTVEKEWTKWIGPVTRIASVFLTGLALPLEDDIARQLSEGAEAMDKLAGLPVEEGSAAPRDGGGPDGRLELASSAELHQFAKLLQAIGLDPKEKGMDLAQTHDGRWLWMTAAEAEAHDRP